MPVRKDIIPRKLERIVRDHLFKNKAVMIHGARQVGKTTLVEHLLSTLNLKYAYLNGDDFDVRERLEQPQIRKLETIIGDAKVLFIDEAQRIPEIGIVIKIVVDRIRDVQVIATGSSSFLPSRGTKEPLTGRAFEFVLYPLSFGELVAHASLLDEKRNLERRLVFGSYPEIVTASGDEIRLLELLSGSYLYRDLSILESVSRPELLEKITRALALQIGSEVSSSEIAQLVGADRNTVEKYIHLLEKAWIVFKLNSLSRNVRNEIKKGKKYYFYDNGIRNAIIRNFNPVRSRTDGGALWENYCIGERIKVQAYEKMNVQRYFWRTTQQQEIDYVEQIDEKYHAYEFKSSLLKKVRFSKTFLDSYEVAQTRLVTPENVEEFFL